MRLYIRRKKPIFPSIHVYVILVLFCENQFGQYVVLGSIEWIEYFRNPPIDSWLCMHGSSLPWWREGRGSGPSLENSNLENYRKYASELPRRTLIPPPPHTHTPLEKCSGYAHACVNVHFFAFAFKFYNFFCYSVSFLSTLKNLIIFLKLYTVWVLTNYDINMITVFTDTVNRPDLYVWII